MLTITGLSSAVSCVEKASKDCIRSLKGRNRFCLNQSVFQKLHSTLTCLFNVIDQWFQNSDEGKINLGVFLDLKKASIPSTIKFYGRIHARGYFPQVVHFLSDKWVKAVLLF